MEVCLIQHMSPNPVQQWGIPVYPHSLMSNCPSPAIKYPEWAESPVSQPVLVHGRVAGGNHAIDHHRAVAGERRKNPLSPVFVS